jgi:uncharacterized protein
MYLVDTNIWLERLLEQARAEEVGRFLDQVPADQLFISDFTFHSIGVILARHRRPEVLLQFVQDAFIDGAVTLISLYPEDVQRLVAAMNRFNLDFDDAYQYIMAEANRLTIVSFDAHFDRTERGRLTPDQVLDAG